MPERQIIFARQSVGGDQELADGSKVSNWFAVAAEQGDQAQSPVILYTTPGFHPVIKVTPAPIIADGTAFGGMQGLSAIDSPVLGKRLVGIVGTTHVFDIGEEPADTMQVEGEPPTALPSDAFAPVTNASGTVFYPPSDEIISVPSTRLIALDGTEDEPPSRLERRNPMKIVTDGRHFLFLDRRGLPRVWTLNDDPAMRGDFTVITTSTEEEGKLDAAETWADVTYITGYFVVATTAGKINHSGLNNLDFNALDFGSASRNFDPIVALESFAGLLYVIGARSVEIFADAGAVPFTFRRQQHVVPRGALAKATVAKDEAALYFVGDDQIVYALNFTALRRISTDSVEYDLRRSFADRARAYTYTEEGHRFYALNMLRKDGIWVNWTLDLTTGLWHNRTDTSTLTVVNLDNNNLAARDDRRGTDEEAYIHAMSRELVTDDDANIFRFMTSTSFHNEQNVLSFPSLTARVAVQGERPYLGTDGEEDPARREEEHAMALRWLDEGRNRYSQPSPKPLDGPYLRWRQLGQTVTGRQFLLETDARAEVNVLVTILDFRYRKGRGELIFGRRRGETNVILGVLYETLKEAGLFGPVLPRNPQEGDTWWLRGENVDDDVAGIYVCLTTGTWTRITNVGATKTVESNDPVIVSTDRSGDVELDFIPNEAFTAMGLGSAARADTGTGSGDIPVLDTNGKVPTAALPSVLNAAVALTPAATVTWNVRTAPNATLSMTRNITLEFGTTGAGDPQDGGTYVLAIAQDTTGGRSLTFPSSIKWRDGAPETIAQGANEVTVFTIRRIGNDVFAAPLLKDAS